MTRGLLFASALVVSGCGTRVLEPRAPPTHEMPAITLPSTPPAVGAARVVLDTLDGPMRVTVESDPTFVPPGAAHAPSRVGELCVTPCVSDLPAGRYRLYLAPTVLNARGDTDDIVFAEGLNFYRRAPGKYETPSLGRIIPPVVVMALGFASAVAGTILVFAQGPNAATSQAIGTTLIVFGAAGLIGGPIWLSQATRATQQDGATTAWREP